MAILMPSLQRVRKQAQAVACMSNIKQWSCCWHMYLEGSGGKLPEGAGASGDWPDKLRPYYKERGALLFLLKSIHQTFYQKWPCTFLRINLAEFAATANSRRVVPQHNGLTLMAAPFPA